MRIMTAVVLFVLVLATDVLAVPQLINYQGKLSSKTGTPVTGTVSIVFSVYTITTGGAPVWTETQSVSVNSGIYNVLLGSATPLPASVFDASALYLGVQVGTDAELSPRQQLSSVPYAIKAASADNVLASAITNTQIAPSAKIDYSKLNHPDTDHATLTPYGHPHSGADITSGTVDVARLNIGTGIGTVAAGDHAHDQVYRKKVGRVAVVAKSGGDYSDPVAAMNALSTWCSSPSATNQCLLKIMPGTYDIGSNPLQMQSYVDIEGSGEIVTKVTSSISSLSASPTNGAVIGANNAEIRFLSIENTGIGAHVAGIYIDSTSPTLFKLSITTTAGTNGYGIYSTAAAASVKEVTSISKYAVANNYGIYLNAGTTTVYQSIAEGISGANGYGIYSESSNGAMMNVTTIGSGNTNSYGFYISNSTGHVFYSSVAVASSGANRYGFYNVNSLMHLFDVYATSYVGGTTSYGMYNNATSGTHTIYVHRSTLDGKTNSIRNGAGYILRLGASGLVGSVNNLGTISCSASYDINMTSLNATCQ